MKKKKIIEFFCDVMLLDIASRLTTESVKSVFYCVKPICCTVYLWLCNMVLGKNNNPSDLSQGINKRLRKALEKSDDFIDARNIFDS